jgi:small subunit ribosomal protein S16
MVVIRLARGGAKKTPFYRIVVADSRMPRDGRFIEQIGHYDPSNDASGLKIKTDRVDHWLKNGAQVSERVSYLVARAKKAAPAA